jgi:segregation and condensation protein B
MNEALQKAEDNNIEEVEELETEVDSINEEEENEITVFDADAEDAAEEEAARLKAEPANNAEVIEEDALKVHSIAELMAIIEALIFVSEEPITVKNLADVLKEDKGWIQTAVESLSEEFNSRESGLQLREIAGGWQITTRAEYNDFVRSYLKSRPSAKLSLPALETLAVIAYKQPVTVPEILEIRGVQSSSAIKTLLDKRLIVAKGRKETVGRPMMYGTSKDFLLQFGLKDLSELPNVEDFEDLAGMGS